MGKYVPQFVQVYSDMADNLSKVQFNVIVKESFQPVVHYAFLGEGAPPPVRDVQRDGIMDDMVCAGLPITYIIDALVNGHYLEFEHIEDMTVVKDWIQLYLDQYKNVDLSKFPDRVAFNKNAEKALNMLKGNIRRNEDWQQTKNPKKIGVVDLLSLM